MTVRSLLPAAVAAALTAAVVLAGQPALLAALLGALAGAATVWLWRRPQAPSSERLLRAVMDASPMAMLLYTENGRICYANRGAREIFFEGCLCEGQNFLKLLAEAPHRLGAALLTKEDGLVRIDVEGMPETFHIARRSFELDGEELHLLMVRRFTSELARREVDVLKNVIRVISHELNNSLAPICSLVRSARLMADRPEHKDKLERALDTIAERAAHLGAFVESYARLARLPAPKPAETPWQPLLARIAELYPAAAVAPAPAPAGWFDAGQIEQVIINLLKNASESGTPSDDIELEIRADDHGSTIEVRDRGQGLRPEALESAFLPFYSTKEGGGGLGLALCREIAQAHGGHIALDNRGGGGCVATVWLPARKPPVDTELTRSRLTLSRA